MCEYGGHEAQRCITGVRGRLVDLCRPTSKRFTDAVTRVLGKHADSIVVDTQASGFECMNVRGGRCRHVALTRAHVWTHCGEGVSVVYSGSTIRTQNGNEENNTCTP